MAKQISSAPENKTVQTPSSATTPSDSTSTSFGFREARPDEYGQSYVIGGQPVSRILPAEE